MIKNKVILTHLFPSLFYQFFAIDDPIYNIKATIFILYDKMFGLRYDCKS